MKKIGVLLFALMMTFILGGCNPSQDGLELDIKHMETLDNFKMSVTSSISGIEVYDLTGKIVWAKKNFEISNSEIQLNLSSVSQGVYFIKISTNNQTIVKRIIKE